MSEKKTTGANLQQLEDLLDLYLVKKAPALPKNVKDILVNFAPWLVILGAILSVPAVLSLFGLGAMMSAMSTRYGVIAPLGFNYVLSLIVLAVVVVLELMALPGLFARSRSGWRLVFYASLVSAISSLLSANLISFLLGTLISLYLLFQIRSYYK